MKLRKSKMLIFLLIATVSIFISCFNIINVSAETVQDGISVTVITDKKEYKSDENVNLTLTLKNTNSYEVQNLEIKNVLPDGISLVSGDILKNNISLKPNEEYSMKLSVKKSDGATIVGDSKNSNTGSKTTITTNSSTSTSNIKSIDTTTNSNENSLTKLGESNTILIILIVMFLSIIGIVLFTKNKNKFNKFFSFLLCIGILNIFGITGVIYATSENNKSITVGSSKKSFTTECTYVIDNVSYIHKIVVSYNLSENNNNSNSDNNANNEKEIEELRKKAESTLNCIISGDYPKDFSYISMYGEIKKDKIGLSELSNTVMSNMKYKFNDIALDKDDEGNIFAIIKCEFENVDMINLVYQLQEENYAEDEYEEYRLLVLDKLKNKDFKTKTFNIDLAMIKIDNVWYLYETPDFNDAITGGLYSQHTLRENAILKELEKRSNRGN